MAVSAWLSPQQVEEGMRLTGTVCRFFVCLTSDF